jgi:hypothetical protein
MKGARQLGEYEQKKEKKEFEFVARQASRRAGQRVPAQPKQVHHIMHALDLTFFRFPKHY